MKLIDLTDPFYKPVWVRVLIVVICIGWGVLEALNGSSGWAVLFVGLGVMCSWRFAVIDYSGDPED